MNLVYVLTILVILFGSVPFLYFLLFRRTKTLETKSILPYLVLTFFASLYELFGTLIIGWNISNWFFIYNILSFLCIFYFYYFELKKGYKSFFIFLFLSFLLLVLYLIYCHSLDDILIISSNFHLFITVFILLASLFWFKNLVNIQKNNYILNGTFYFISAFVLYYCGTLFLFLLSNGLYISNSKLFFEYWSINIILNLIKFIFLIMGLWKMKNN
jgi:hypothetical protein